MFYVQKIRIVVPLIGSSRSLSKIKPSASGEQILNLAVHYGHFFGSGFPHVKKITESVYEEDA